MKLLFKVNVGTEMIDFQDVRSMMKVSCELEDHTDLMTDNLIMPKKDPRHLRLTTYSMYRMLNEGHHHVVESMYVDNDVLVESHAVEYVELKQFRRDFLCDQYIEDVVDTATEVYKGLDIKHDLSEENKKRLLSNHVRLKYQAIAILFMSLSILNFNEVRPFERPQLDLSLIHI